MKRILFLGFSTLGILMLTAGGYEVTKSFSTIQYYDLIRSVKRRYGFEHVPDGLTLATIDTESNFQADAIREEEKDNSYGLMQILEGTARDMGFKGDPEDLLDPETNIRFGTAYQSWLFKRYNDWNAVIHAYNEGPGNYDKGIRQPIYYGKVKGRWAKWDGLLAAGDIL
jgi:soluble lytic murein transglycosylase-like protein